MPQGGLPKKNICKQNVCHGGESKIVRLFHKAQQGV